MRNYGIIVIINHCGYNLVTFCNTSIEIYNTGYNDVSLMITIAYIYIYIYIYIT